MTQPTSDRVMYTVVVGIPVNQQGKFLVTQRNAPNHPEVHGKWQLAGGGVEWGETTEQTLAREFQEELGVATTILFPHPIVKTTIWYAHPEGHPVDSHALLIGYVVSIDDVSPERQPDEETLAWRWVTLPEVMKLDTLPNTREFLMAAQELIEREQLLGHISK
jgi:8-oxo-dGTP diphosphatase